MRNKKHIVLIFFIYFVFYITGVGCPIKFLTGISCGGCGMTRALICLGALDIKEALFFHPLIFLVPVYAVVYMIRKRMKKRDFDIITFGIAMLFFAVYIIRLINPYDMIVTVDIENGFIFKSTKEILEVLFLMVEERRSLLTLILLNIITCGIYSFFWYHNLAKDMNTVCYNDGEDTPGIGHYILFSILTCGFYSYYWFYKLANRQQANGRRYGLDIKEDGTTILMWMIFGMLLFFVGIYVALYIVIKNMNLLAHAYNQSHLASNGGNFGNQPALQNHNEYNQNSYNGVNEVPALNYGTDNDHTQDYEKTASVATAGTLLCCSSGEFAGCEFPIGMNETVIIGRSMSCNIKFDSNTPNVSRTHCEVAYDGKVWITDKGSSFGTFLSDGTRLSPEQRTELTTGFYLGNRDISFYIK